VRVKNSLNRIVYLIKTTNFTLKTSPLDLLNARGNNLGKFDEENSKIEFNKTSPIIIRIFL
jgi:hypothetical protein